MICTLYTTFYRDRHPERRMELDLSLAMNATAFDRVRVLSEGVPRKPSGNVEWRMSPDRQTYAMVLEWIAEDALSDEISVISNCDIIIPPASVELIRRYLVAGEMWCLARYEIGHAGESALHDVDFSQDVWIIRGKPRAIVGQYPFGIPGCENHFAREMNEAGYQLSNPSRSVKTFHMHWTGLRTETNSRQHRMPPPYLFLSPHFIGEQTKLRRIAKPTEPMDARKIEQLCEPSKTA